MGRKSRQYTLLEYWILALLSAHGWIHLMYLAQYPHLPFCIVFFIQLIRYSTEPLLFLWKNCTRVEQYGNYEGFWNWHVVSEDIRVQRPQLTNFVLWWKNYRKSPRQNTLTRRINRGGPQLSFYFFWNQRRRMGPNQRPFSDQCTLHRAGTHNRTHHTHIIIPELGTHSLFPGSLSAHFISMDRYRSSAHLANFQVCSSLNRSKKNQWFALGKER